MSITKPTSIQNTIPRLANIIPAIARPETFDFNPIMENNKLNTNNKMDANGRMYTNENKLPAKITAKPISAKTKPKIAATDRSSGS